MKTDNFTTLRLRSLRLRSGQAGQALTQSSQRGVCAIGQAATSRMKFASTRALAPGVAAILAAAVLLGCNRQGCEDRGAAAIQAALPHLSQDVVSNLVREASQCISNALGESVVPKFYTPISAEAPVAYGLRVEPASDFSFGMGATVVVRTVGTSAPYMAVRVPVHMGPGLCLWEVYVCVKPGGGFSKDNPSWVAAEGSTRAAPVAKLSDDVWVYAQERKTE